MRDKLLTDNACPKYYFYFAMLFAFCSNIFICVYKMLRRHDKEGVIVFIVKICLHK